MSSWILLLCFISLGSSAQHYRYKFTMGRTTFYGIASSTSGIGQIDSQWLEIITVQEVESSVSPKVGSTLDALVNSYISGGECKPFLSNAAISETNSLQKFNKLRVSWTNICIILIELMRRRTTLGISYELHKTFYYKLTMQLKTYYGTGEAISGPTNSLCVQIESVEMVHDGLQIIKETMPTAKDLTAIYRSLSKPLSYFEMLTKTDIVENLSDPSILWTEMRVVVPSKPPATGTSLTLSYEVRKLFLYNITLHGETYYGSAEDISGRRTSAIMKVESVDNVENYLNENLDESPTPQLLTQKYKDANKEDPIYASIAKSDLPREGAEERKIVYRPIRINEVKPLDDMSTLSVSYYIYQYCHYQFTVGEDVYYGTAEMGVTVGQSLYFKIMAVNFLHNPNATLSPAQLMTLVRNSSIVYTAISPVNYHNVECIPMRTIWTPINIGFPLEKNSVSVPYTTMKAEVVNATYSDETQISLRAFVWQKSQERIHDAAPEGWGGLLLISLTELSGTPFLTARIKDSGMLALELKTENLLLMVEIKRRLAGCNSRFEGVIHATFPTGGRNSGRMKK